MKKGSFVIAIESYIVRKGIASILRKIDGVDIIAETDNVDILKNAIREYNPDYLILSEDFHRKLVSSIGEASDLAHRVVLIQDGANGIADSSVAFSMHLKTPGHVIREDLQKLLQPSKEESSGRTENQLTDRERTILKYVTTGLTNKEIADKLFLSLHTVTTHRKNIGNKLGIKSVSGLTVYAIVNNIISIDDIQEQA